MRPRTGLARALRQDSTTSEALLWAALRRKSLDGRKFRRQHPIGRYVVDFYCVEERLIVEVDGPIHQGQRGDDRERDGFLRARRLKIVRVPSDEVERDIGGVLNRIRKEFAAGTQAPLPRRAGEG
ncbi:MAG: DUF559 domain-containing protein [Dehalococcoidia bacterium]